MAHQSELIAQDIQGYLKQHENKTLLRFITCGSVDDGKSTLIGRLLHDTKLIYEDQLAAIQRDSQKHNTTGGEEIDLALLVDGLQSEREQGITIDVAYRYFSTDQRKYIIADTPGHEQYTRNMATGVSTAQLAIILIDARYGVQTQTRRHSFICALLGIRHLVVAINKMDLMQFDEQIFDRIRTDYLHFSQQLPNRQALDIQFIPLSALKGDNVVNLSTAMPWYQGPTLMHLLDTIKIDRKVNTQDFRFPVQYVNRPNLDFRGYCGTVASGIVCVGDSIRVLPSGKVGTIKQIVTWAGEQFSAWAGQAVTLTLNGEIDISRGDTITSALAKVETGLLFDAHFVWMSDEPLKIGKTYLFKLGTHTASGCFTEIHNQIDINTLLPHKADHLPLNGIGLCRVELTTPTVLDAYEQLPETGGLIVIDKLDNVTLGAGIVVQKVEIGPYEIKANDSKAEVVWNHTTVTPALRAAQKGQTGKCIWFTGLSGSGKSTLANALEQELYKRGYHTMLLDGDNVRHGLSKDLGMKIEDREENIRRVAEVAKLMVEAGLVVITAFISPLNKSRDNARRLFRKNDFVEVYVDTSLQLCEQRDTKGLYKKARSGLIKDFTGVDSMYEVPENPEMVLDGGHSDINEQVSQIISFCLSRDRER